MDTDKMTLDRTKESVKFELDHLKKVIESLRHGLGDIAGYRKEIQDFLIEYRKQTLEENRFDEDKPQDFIDQELLSREEAYKAALKKINELEELIDNPYFGKITFKEKGLPEEDIYIGKYGYIDEKNYDPLVIDWRAPIASLFYHGGLGKAQYNTPDGKVEAQISNRRQFIIKASELLGMFDTETEVRDEILQYVLSSSSSQKLKDIIMTIQKEQDEIIRFRKSGAVVVNGIAGSGKTTVALHRVAYLIYNYRKELENKVLILGPNNIFMEYIASVLPTLGEHSVRQNTIWDFLYEAIEEKVDVLPQKDFLEAIAQGDEELRKDAQLKRSSGYIDSMKEYADRLNHILYPPKDIYFLDTLLISEDEMRKDLTENFVTMPLKRRGARLKRILIGRMKEVRNRRMKEIDKAFKEQGDDILKGGITENPMARRELIRELIEKVLDFRAEITYLGKGSAVELYMRQNSMRILTHEDLIPLLYLKHRIEGIRLPYSVRYLVIDEAQDLSLNYFRVLSEVTGCKDMTVVGDINQRLVTYDTEDDFLLLDRVLKDVTSFNLLNSYRSTEEIIRYSDTFLKETQSKSLRNGEPVRIYSENEDTLEEKIISEYEYLKDKGMENIAIITRDAEYAEKLSLRIRDRIYHKFVRNEDGVYNAGTLLLSAYLAKGLEFDGVICVDDRPDTPVPDLIKYIISTRALHLLSVINVEDSK